MRSVEDWIVFYRPILRGASERGQSVADGLESAIQLRDAVIAHWGLTPAESDQNAAARHSGLTRKV